MLRSHSLCAYSQTLNIIREVDKISLHVPHQKWSTSHFYRTSLCFQCFAKSMLHSHSLCTYSQILNIVRRMWCWWKLACKSHTKSDLQVIFIIQTCGVNVINLFCQVNAPLAFILLMLTNIQHHQQDLMSIKASLHVPHQKWPTNLLEWSYSQG